MKRRKYFLLLGLLLISNLSFSQDPQRDSLLNVLSLAKEDTLKVNVLNALSTLLNRTDPTEAITYGSEARDLAEKLEYKPGLALALKNIGLGYYFLANYVEALIQWENSLSMFESLQDDVMTANLMGNLALIYSTQGDDAKAIDYLLRSLKIAEDLGDSLRIATVLLNIGVIYSTKPVSRDKAIEYWWRALNLSEAIDYQDGIGMVSFNIGETYFQKGNYDSALYYFDKSSIAYENTIVKVASLNYIGSVYAEKEDFQTAIEYQTQALNLAESFDTKLEMAQTLLGLADTYKKQGNIKLAISYFEQAKAIAEEIDSDLDMKDAYEGLALSYSELSDFRNAFRYQTLLNRINETIFNIETDDKIKNLQFSYQLDKKEDEIEILEQQSEIEQLNTKRQKLVKDISLAGFGAILIIAFILFRNYRNKVKTNRILDKKNVEIESLLLNILPEETARELQQDGYATPRYYESVSVLFTDFIGFTKIAEGLKPHELIAELNSYFNAFDDIIEKYHLEKIKTIGDSYMCAGGIPTPNTTHPCRIVQAGLAMQEYMDIKNEQCKKLGKKPWGLRIGIHTGPVVAGVVGNKKYAYDIWGDTVNIASRMESKGEVGKVNISAATYKLINDNYECKYRGKIAAKNKGNIDMYFIEKEMTLAQG
ncbi:MAG: tetratricopeptide repeat protein [Cyclobacteriaceae bacterium]|nr:tetratricopeptide repeat protein [Cyclobacteriaceae bacterium]